MRRKKFPSEKELKAIRKKLDTGLASQMLPQDASIVERTKYNLCRQFVIYKRENELSQKELAELVGIDDALMSKILHYHIKEFTTDRLLRYLSKLHPDIELKFKVA